ncbi:MerR family transcriptional regulator, mercuric resistance operon regulatory protein [Pseudoalteromonas sp. BSi20480]|jgi:MerR family mercuric resistance operon transcriptional regulator|nr:MerR family transcriptional regulator [Pseudoalteromonas sp. BSi20480]GAA74855.1 MerR family transcriptional regulator, mercuric resistance operon regulatory protein [Pseudoalteromonas sp. BSi20480]
MKTIGKLAKSLNLNVETIRFYEREGLITQPIKPISGYRQYDESITGQLRFITKAKALGFTLREIKLLMSMDNNCSQVELLSRQKLAIIRDKINDLQRLEKVILDMTNTCMQNEDPTHCPIIDSLK